MQVYRRSTLNFMFETFLPSGNVTFTNYSYNSNLRNKYVSVIYRSAHNYIFY